LIADVYDDVVAPIQKREEGNIFFKFSTLLCLGIGLVIVVMLLYDIITQTFIIHTNDNIIFLFVFVLGFVVGWIVREPTKR